MNTRKVNARKVNARKLLVSVLMLVSVLFSACAPAATPPAPTAIPPTAAPPTVAPTDAPAQVETPFSSDKFQLPMSVTFGTDWNIIYDKPSMFRIDNQHDFGLAFYIVTNAKLADTVDGHLIPFPDDFVSWIKSDPDFTVGELTAVTVAGIEGLQIDATPIWKSTTTHLKLFLSLSGTGLGDASGNGENIVTDPEQWRFILLDNVNGERLLIILIDGNGHDFQDAVAQSQAVLDSVVFTN